MTDLGKVSLATQPDAPLPAPVVPRRRSRSFRKRHQLGMIGLTMVGVVVLSTLLGPLFLGIDPNLQNLANRLAPPGSTYEGQLHVLGTDNLGRDVLARVFAGGRASLSVVVMALFLGAGLGTVLGAVSGFYGGWIDNVIMRLVDAQLALPTLVLAMLVAATLGTGFFNTAITLGVATWPIYARLIRAEVLKIREEDYIEAGIALGGSDRRLLIRHITPNIMSSLLVVASLELGHMVLVESSLSFLGFGMQPPDASWGSMIRDGQSYIQAAWWLSAVPGAFIVAIVLGLNLAGDWLRDVLDPHLK